MPGVLSVQISEYGSGTFSWFSLFILFVRFSYFPLAGGKFALLYLYYGGIRSSPFLVSGRISTSSFSLSGDDILTSS